MFLIDLDSDGYLLEDQSNLRYLHATTSYNAAIDDQSFFIGLEERE